jgi:CYTH domain-containing protein
VHEGDLKWEIDQYRDQGLVIAEVEYGAPSNPPPPPDWLKPYIREDVTGNRAYFNKVLATE